MAETDDVPLIGTGKRRASQSSRRRPSSSHQLQPSMQSSSSVPASPLKVEFLAPSPSAHTSPLGEPQSLPDQRQQQLQLQEQQQQQQQSPPAHIPLPPPRTRVNSILKRGLDIAQSATSPLAQIFQPLIVDDDMGVGGGAWCRRELDVVGESN